MVIKKKPKKKTMNNSVIVDIDPKTGKLQILNAYSDKGMEKSTMENFTQHSPSKTNSKRKEKVPTPSTSATIKKMKEQTSTIRKARIKKTPRKGWGG